MKRPNDSELIEAALQLELGARDLRARAEDRAHDSPMASDFRRRAEKLDVVAVWLDNLRANGWNLPAVLNEIRRELEATGTEIDAERWRRTREEAEP